MAKGELISQTDLDNINLMKKEDLDKDKYNPLEEFDKAHDGAFNSLILPKPYKGHKARPWGFNKAMTSEVPGFIEVSEFIREIARRRLELGAVCAISYLAGTRISELLGRKFGDGTSWAGIRWRDIIYDDSGELPVLKIRTICEKRNENWDIVKTKKTYQFIFKTMPIPHTADYLPILDVFYKFAEDKEQELDEPIFKGITDDMVRAFLNSHYQVGCHCFRDWRVTHAASFHHMNESELRTLFGWNDRSNMPSKYSHASAGIIASKLKILTTY
jgi:integrase